MAVKCANCGSSIGGMFGAELISKARLAEFQKFIDCPDELCTKCDGPFETRYDKERQERAVRESSSQMAAQLSPLQKALAKMPLVSVS